MKVAQILYSGLGGHGSVAFSLANGDAEGRWSNVLGFVGIEPLLREYCSRCERALIPYRYFPTKPARPWRQWSAIGQWLATERPDAIINHSSTALIPCILHAKAQRTKLVYVEHTPIQIKPRNDWIASRLAMMFADSVVMLTPEYARLSHERLGRWMRREKVSIIPNGVDTNRFVPAAPTKRCASQKRIGMAGRFSNAKRQDLLVHVIDSLQKHSPEYQWQLSLAGDGEERERVMVLAADVAPDLVEFVGVLDEEALISWFQTLDIYVHASNGETLSTSVLQGMACGLPIVGSKVTGIEDLVSPETGIVVENDQPTAWVNAIAHLESQRSAAVRLGESARRICEKHYSAHEMHRRYDELIRSHAPR